MKDKVDKGKNRNLATDTLLRWSKFKRQLVVASHSAGVLKISKN